MSFGSGFESSEKEVLSRNRRIGLFLYVVRVLVCEIVVRSTSSVRANRSPSCKETGPNTPWWNRLPHFSGLKSPLVFSSFDMNVAIILHVSCNKARIELCFVQVGSYRCVVTRTATAVCRHNVESDDFAWMQTIETLKKWRYVCTIWCM